MAPQPPPSPISLPSNTASAAGALSPTSPQSPQSPSEHGFFGAIVDRARSRSRSKMERSRSRSPLPTPLNSPSPEEARPEPQRQPSAASSNLRSFSTDSTLVDHPIRYPPKRHSTDVSEWDRLTYGRHSGDWLFNGFSLTEVAKDAANRLRRKD